MIERLIWRMWSSLTMRRLAVMSGLVLVAFLYIPPDLTAHAQTSAPSPIPVSDDQVNAIAHNLYCPVCANTPLDVCASAACARWREQIREMLSQGENEDQIRQYFINTFGMRTVAIPTDTTSQIIVFILPFALILIAGGLIIWQLMRWGRARSALVVNGEAPPVGESVGINSVNDEYRNRVESELRDE